MIAAIVLLSMLVLAVGYFTYGRFLSRRLDLDDRRPTPACEINDGVDHVPVRASMLVGQHFSAIAAAGPIVGPILAGLWFGWLPALLWIVLGTLFIGGMHDFGSLVASVRHGGASIGSIVGRYMSRTSKNLFLVFVWLALVYVIVAFTDITAQTFVAVTDDQAFGPAVAASSTLYLVLGLAMGLVLRFTKLPFALVTGGFVLLVAASLWAGLNLPPALGAALQAIPLKQWELILLAYCCVASLLPVWLLLQPRGYLGGWFLYLVMAAALIGALAGGYTVQYPALNLAGFHSLANGKLLFPAVFITVACGACSGFHGIVSSGTTSKQVANERDTRLVGYGAMVLEAVVAVLALATVMTLAKGDPGLKGDPNVIFARGIGRYLALVGVDPVVGLTFALLAFATFVYDTLDVSTRLARYVLQELTGWTGRVGAMAATLITLAVPAVFLMRTSEKGYLVAWPIFGTSNQLLASLTLLALSVWLFRTGRRAWYAVIPMAFMLAMTLWALVLQVLPFYRQLMAGGGVSSDTALGGICGTVLLLLSAWLLLEAATLLKPAAAVAEGRLKAEAEG